MSMSFVNVFADYQVTIIDNKGVTWGFDLLSEWSTYNYEPYAAVLRSTSVPEGEVYPEDVTVPGEVTYEGNTYPVEQIGSNVFSDNLTVTTITLPVTIKRIEYYAFQGCRSLKEVKNTMNCEYISGQAFYQCVSLTEIDLSSCKTIEWSAFGNCTSLKSVKSLAKIESIGSSAFSECKALKEIDLPSGVVIEGYAFSSCTNLTKVGSLDKATINDGAFSSCEALKSVDLSTAKKIGSYAFNNCTSLESVGNLSTLGGLGECVFQNCTSLTEIDLSSCKTIGRSAFSNCSKLSKVVLSVCNSIDGYAFEGCPIQSIDLSTVKLLGEGAFRECKNLEDIVGLGNLTKLANYVFYNCSSLKKVDLSTIGEIGYETFSGCKNLESIGNIAKVTDINYRVFYECNSLKSIDLSKIVKIDDEAFNNCSSLTEIDLTACVEISNNAFRGCSSLKQVGGFSHFTEVPSNLFYGCSSLETIDVSKCKTIGQNAFYGCKALKSVDLSVCETIGSNAFVDCSSLESVNMPLVKTFPAAEWSWWYDDNGNYRDGYRGVFSGCSSLKEVKIPACETIGNSMFMNCAALETVDLTNCKSIDNDVFSGCKSLKSIIIPACDSLGNSVFKNCASLEIINLSKCKTIGDDVFYGCTLLKELDLSVCVSIGNRVFMGCASLTSIYLPLIVSIPDAYHEGWYDENGNWQSGYRGVFTGCSALKEVKIPACKSIGSYVFKDCALLESIDLSNCKTIGENSFYGCKSLKSVSIPACDSLGNSVFRGCVLIEKLDISKCRIIGDEAFYGCSALKEIDLSTCTTLGSRAFRGCVSLTSINMPLVASIPEGTNDSWIDEKGNWQSGYRGVFDGCTALKEVKIPACKSIGSSAFRDCAALEQIDLTVCKTIGGDAFYGCKALKELNLPACDSLGSRPFLGCASLETINMPLVKNIPEGYSDSWYDENGEYHWDYRGTFWGCKSLKEVKAPACTSLANSVFKGCVLLENIDLSSCNTIGDEAFSGCMALKEIKASVCDSIGSSVFVNCVSLVKVDLSKCRIIGSQVFLGCTSLASIELPLVKMIPDGVYDNWYDQTDGNWKSGYKGSFSGCTSLKEVKIPVCETIGAYAFRDCSTLENIDLTKVKFVGDEAFYGCNAIKSISLSACDSIGSRVFMNCVALETVDLPLVKMIPDGSYENWYDETDGNWKSGYKGTFSGCTSLKEVKIPACETIGVSAFADCAIIEEIDLSKVKTINNGAFSSCKSIKKLSIPECETLGSSVFEGCDSLTTIALAKVKTMGSSVFASCKSLKEVDIPVCDSIGSSTFRDCVALETIDLPLVKSLPDGYYRSYYDDSGMWRDEFTGTFWGCKSLKKVSIPVCKMIGNGSFASCSSLASIGTLAGCDSIGSSAFSGCNNLGNFVIESTTLKYIGNNAFDYVGQITLMSTTPATITAQSFGENIFIMVPSDVLETYQAASGWHDIRNRIFAIGDKFDYDLYVTASDKSSGIFDVLGEEDLRKVVNLKLKGTINSYDFMILRDKTPNLHNLDLTETSVLACPTYEYYKGYTSKNDTITTNCFSGLNKLLSVKLPKTVKYIEYNAFSDCRNLQSVEMYEGLQYIDNNSFSGCESIKELVLPKGIESIGYGAFSNCRSLESVTLPDGLKRINGWAFNNCTSLKEVKFPSSLQSIGDYAFAWCYSLPSIDLPSRLITIENSAFTYCSNLRELNIPSSVKNIYENAFYGCDNLNKVYTYTVLPTDINQNTFSNYENATLYIPKFTDSYNNYWWATAWSQFGTRLPFDKPYSYFYVSTDYTLDEDRIDGTPDADLNPGGALMVEGTDYQELNDLTVMSDGNGTGGTVIADDNISVKNLKYEIDVQSNRWYFFSFPFDISFSNIKCDGEFVFRYYDGEARATNGYGGWKSIGGSQDVLKRGVGYIFQCSKQGKLVLNIDDPSFKAEDVSETLIAYTSTNAQDAGWNFIGNPFTSYFDINDTQYKSPITIWNHETQSYEAIRPGDDEYHFYPFQAFFVQQSGSQSEITFNSNSRTTYYKATKKNSEAKARRMTRGVDDSRQLVELTIAGSKVTDKTRIVFNEEAKAGYETECDAAKFMSTAGVPQIYSMDGQGIKYAINERPTGEVKIAYQVKEEGSYTISAKRMDVLVSLYDNETRTTFDLSNGDYTFESKAGTFESRFTMKLTAASSTSLATIKTETGVSVMGSDDGIYINNVGNAQVDIFSLSGVRLGSSVGDGFVRLPKATYVVKVNDMSTKVLVK